MPKENKTRYALLGLLQGSPMSGYDLKKFCDKSIGCFWNENYSNIYPVLKNMQASGLVTMEIHEQDKSPSKKVYTITDSGTKTLLDWLKRPPENRLLREELLLQVGFGYMTDRNTILEKLKNRKADCENTLGQLQETAQYLDNLIETEPALEQKDIDHHLSVTYMRHTVSFGLKFFQMEIDWCEETMTELQS